MMGRLRTEIVTWMEGWMVDGRSMDRSMDGSNSRAGRPTCRPALSARSRIRIVPPLSVSQSAIRARGRAPPRGDQSVSGPPSVLQPPTHSGTCRPARRRLPAGRAPRRIALCDESSSSRGRSPSLSFGWRFASLRRGARSLLLVMCTRAYDAPGAGQPVTLATCSWLRGGGGTAGRPLTGAADGGRAHTARARRAPGAQRAGGAGAAAARRRPARAEAVTCESVSNFTRASARAPRRAAADAPLRSTPVAAAHGPAAALQPPALSRELPGDGEQAGADSAAEVANRLTASLGKN